jgi:PEP-utilising enzyme, mobile domain
MQRWITDAEPTARFPLYTRASVGKVLPEPSACWRGRWYGSPVEPITDPSWTPLFVPAAAVVVEVGAQVRHAVIVSRELGIPCVVSVRGATRTIPDGAVVTVDGSSGTVTVIELPEG